MEKIRIPPGLRMSRMKASASSTESRYSMMLDEITTSAAARPWPLPGGRRLCMKSTLRKLWSASVLRAMLSIPGALAYDLGCGPGIVTCEIAPYAERDLAGHNSGTAAEVIGKRAGLHEARDEAAPDYDAVFPIGIAFIRRMEIRGDLGMKSDSV